MNEYVLDKIRQDWQPPLNNVIAQNCSTLDISQGTGDWSKTS